MDDRNYPELPTDYLVKLMEIILKNNLFNFHDELYRQEIGCAMGTKPAPSYADNFMARRMDNKIISLEINRDNLNTDNRPNMILTLLVCMIHMVSYDCQLNDGLMFKDLRI